MAPHSRTLAWKIPWMEEPGGLQSMGSLSRGSILFLVQEANHAELMEHEASLSRNAQEEKLSLQQVIQDITQVPVSLPSW